VNPLPDQSESVLSVTMTPEAAQRFRAALRYAAARIEDEDHADWLTWGIGRVALAERAFDEEQA
jgi:hypothetical protein